ncbi:hypothetical protein [Citrobacter amalonaticus]|uniref:hypothetical protein n=1 Tax=Citrobacter amalonaticus TaxID=35703 RepID=UPI001E3357E0|nr:hypothetical protein [Citrobacter amalonaticus]GJK88164.1 hypothetical protein TUM17567_44590 [Citrobacter amalonaticus]
MVRQKCSGIRRSYLVDKLEAELQCGELSEANLAWLAQCGLPLALIDVNGLVAWCVESDCGRITRKTGTAYPSTGAAVG